MADLLFCKPIPSPNLFYTYEEELNLEFLFKE